MNNGVPSSLASRPTFAGSQVGHRAHFAVAVTLPLMVAALGCQAGEDEGGGPGRGIEINTSAAVSSANGLKTANGLRTHNGLTLVSGLSRAEGLSPSSGLMSTTDGRAQVAYLVKCALPATRTLVKTDRQGTSYSFPGLIGLAPEWETGSCGQNCQEWVTACVLSLINTTGVHVPVWMMADIPAIGFGRDSNYPRQEGAFFGNIFRATPEAYYCAGRDYRVNPVPGRIGSPQVDSSYSNIYGTNGLCAPNCAGSDHPHTGDGFKACSGWNHVVTIWRQ